MPHSTTVALTGHLLDTGVLARVLDDVLEYGGDYLVESLDLGRRHEDESRALVRVTTDDGDLLERIVMRLQTHGANAVDPGTATLRPAPADGVFPDDFYSTTNLDTSVRLGGRWVPVDRAEMDCGLVVAPRVIGLSADLGLVLGVAAVAGGVGVLLSRMRERSTDDGDDGAVV